MDHDHDDGLVHSHGWATEPPPCVGQLLRPANDAAQRVEVKPRAEAEDHDDGLVHSHAWASGEQRKLAG